MKNPDCECCLGNGYYCMCCDPHGDQPHMPHGYKHPGGYVWDAENHRQLTQGEWDALQKGPSSLVYPLTILKEEIRKLWLYRPPVVHPARPEFVYRMRGLLDAARMLSIYEADREFMREFSLISYRG